jgi:hypothetical protein
MAAFLFLIPASMAALVIAGAVADLIEKFIW